LKNNTKSVIALGTFDGVHLGHQKIIAKLLSEAEKRNATPIIVTFFPHPTHVLTPDMPLKMINSIEERVVLLEKLGVKVIVEEFTKDFSKKTALTFIQENLLQELHMDCLIVGYDHRFGKGKEGDYDTLKVYGKKYNFDVIQVEAYQLESIISSSTHIRHLINNGSIQTANIFLDYPFCLFGTVVKGNQLGRKIGFKTANIKLDYPNKIIPKTGVYIGASTIDGSQYFAMINIGYRPTVDGKTRTIEIHYFDFDANLYDQQIGVQLISRIRDEVKFASIDALRKQLNQDKIYALNYLKNYGKNKTK